MLYTSAYGGIRDLTVNDTYVAVLCGNNLPRSDDSDDAPAPHATVIPVIIDRTSRS